MGQILHGSARPTAAVRAAIQRSQERLQALATRPSISRLPSTEDGLSVPKKKFRDYPIGYLHVDFAEGQTEEGRRYRPNA